MTPWARLTFASVLLATLHAAHAQVLTAGHGWGWGNIGIGSTEGAFEKSFDFTLLSADPEQRLDLTMTAGSGWRSTDPDTNPDALHPITFTGVTLSSQDGSQFYEHYLLSPGDGEISYTFGQLATGATYRVTFSGIAAQPSDGSFWPHAEWGMGGQAMASATPEPSDLAMLAIGLVGVACWSTRQKQVRQTQVQPTPKPA